MLPIVDLNLFRYIICKSLRGSVRDIVRPYMCEINNRINQYKVDPTNVDILSIVPMEILKGNERFSEYIRDSNNQ